MKFHRRHQIYETRDSGKARRWAEPRRRIGRVRKSVAAALLNDGKVKLTDCYSEKTGKTYDATIFLEDDGTKTNFRLEFENRKGNSI